MFPVMVRIGTPAYSVGGRIVPRRFKVSNTPSWESKMKMQSALHRAAFCLALSWLIIPFSAHAQNQVLGELQLVGKTKADKTSGVCIDGQYVGYFNEMKDNNTILLLHGEDEIAVGQSGYTDFRQKVVVKPRKKIVLQVVMLRDPRAQLPRVTS